MTTTFLKIHPQDNVLVALTDLKAGTEIRYNGASFVLKQDVPAKHKFVYKPFASDEEIFMYGVLVGKAVSPIEAGSAIGTHNVKHKASAFTGQTQTQAWTAPDVTKWKNRTFNGYHRKDGQVGTGNYWVVVPLVFCENRNVNVLRNAFEEALGFKKEDPYRSYVSNLVDLYKKGDTSKITNQQVRIDNVTTSRVFKNVDGVKFLTHEGGCGGTRQDSEALCALIAGYIMNPNVGGATILSLGCQNAQASILREKLDKLNFNNSKPLIILEQQKEGTEQELIVKAIQETFLGLIEMDKLERKPAPLSKLVVGLECGGSDGFSGISANPAVGHASDLVVALGRNDYPL